MLVGQGFFQLTSDIFSFSPKKTRPTRIKRFSAGAVSLNCAKYSDATYTVARLDESTGKKKPGNCINYADFSNCFRFTAEISINAPLIEGAFPPL